jgi:hypothetical protein
MMFVLIILFAAGTIFIGLLGSCPIQLRWLLITALFIFFLAATGKVVTGNKVDTENLVHRFFNKGGRWTGILIDSRFKMSLSRLQLALWTILALSAFATIALDRTIPVLENMIPDSSSEEEPYDALNIKFPEELLIALGISTTSLAGASIIKSSKADQTSTRVTQLLSDQRAVATSQYTEAQRVIGEARDEISNYQKAVSDFQDNTGDAQVQLTLERLEKESLPEAQKKLKNGENALERATATLAELDKATSGSDGDVQTNENIHQAEWADMFRGELLSNFRIVDIAKVQMFFFTIIIIFTYGTLIWGLLDSDNLRMASIELPAFSASLNGLLGISHAGYLVVKQTG